MIGQSRLQKINLPNNLLLVGPKGFGKKTLLHEISPYEIIKVDNSVSAIKNLLPVADTLYLFADFDDWNYLCYSAVLKLLEENTKHKFAITVKNIQSIPDTIVSRCVVEYMDPYTEEEIGNDYCTNIWQANECTDELLYIVDDFITKPCNLNCIKFKQSDNGYDLELFLSVLESRCLSMLSRESSGALNRQINIILYITSKYLLEINVKHSNKKLLYLAWLSEVQHLMEVTQNE